jgi:hypothetical protein
MPSMVSYPRRLQNGHITCYLNRTYHVLTTVRKFHVAKSLESWHLLTSSSRKDAQIVGFNQ